MTDLSQIPDLVEIPCVVEEQLTLEWCWLSCARAISNFLNPKGKQYSEGDLANLILGKTNCTINPTPKECIVPGTNQMISDLYQKHLGITGLLDQPLTFMSCLNETVNNRPFQIGYKGANGEGHMVICAGHRRIGKNLTQQINPSTIEFRILDPFYGNGDVLWQTWDIMYQTNSRIWFETFGQFRLINPTYTSPPPPPPPPPPPTTTSPTTTQKTTSPPPATSKPVTPTKKTHSKSKKK